MKKAYLLLLKYEIRKLFTVPKIIIAVIITLLISGVFIIIPAAMNNDIKNFTNLFSYEKVLSYLLKFTMWLPPFLISAGVISQDIKSHWLRTILVKPIKRETFLSIKLLASYIALFVFMMAWVILPSILGANLIGFKMNSLADTLLIMLMYYLQGILIVSLATLFSCFLPSFLNIVVIIAWIIIDSIQSLVLSFLQDVKPMVTIFSEFFFPTGFSDAANTISQGSGFSFEYFSWGAAILCLTLALTYFTFSRIAIDKAGD